MARANTKTLLSLDRFAAVLGIHPLHFNQVFLRDLPNQPDGTTARTCDVPIMQHSWQQASRIGREDIADAIARAEDLMIEKLGFRMMPDWCEQRHERRTRPSDPTLYGGHYDLRGQFKTVQAGCGYVISGGRAAKTLIEAAVNITYSDQDGDGYQERAQIGFPTTVTDVEEIAVYYPGHAGDDAWQIRPLDYVSIDTVAGLCTVRFKREQAIFESAMETYFPTGLDGVDSALFLTDVDVYRLYNDPSLQSRAIWDSIGGSCSCDGTSSCTICGYQTQDGCLVVRDPHLGVVSVQPGEWDAATGTFTASEFALGREPDRVTLWLRSGWRNLRLARPNVMMDPMFERAIAVYALTMLDRPLCNCQPLEATFQRWREDLSLSSSSPQGSSGWRQAPGALRNPFGTTRGAIYAWEIVSERMLGQQVTPP